jgi:hypothetical protein
MGFSVNDIRYASHDVAIADATNITGGPCRIYGMGVSAAAAVATLTIYNNSAASGADAIQLNSLGNASNEFDFGHTGIRFDTNLSIASTGTPDALWVAYKAE